VPRVIIAIVVCRFYFFIAANVSERDEKAGSSPQTNFFLNFLYLLTILYSEEEKTNRFCVNKLANKLF
jgi:hypothetical protein